MEQMVAVINGDLVGSSALSAEQRALFHSWLSQLPEELAQEFEEGGAILADSFRGDSWQLLVPVPGLSLRVALYLEAWLLSNFEALPQAARIGIGVGRQWLEPGMDLASSDGPAFRRSGSAIDASYHGSRLQIELPNELAGYPSDSLQALLALMDEVISSWTSKQAQAMQGALLGRTQRVIGDHWPNGPISQQAVGQHLDRAGWAALQVGLTHFETWLPTLLPGAAS
jgi:hypothetical protein